MNEPHTSALQLGAGWRARTRPRPGFGHMLGAAAGIFAVVAVITLAAEIAEDEPRIAGTIASVVLVVAALIAATAIAGPVRSAAVTTLVASVPLAFGFLILGDNDAPSRDDVTLLLVLTLAAYLALYFTGATRGRGVFLGLALFAIWIVILVQVGSEDAIVPFQRELGGIAASAIGFGGGGGATSDDVAVASLVIGVIMLAVALAMDHRHLVGAATPFVAVGAIATIVGAAVLGIDDDRTTGGLLLAGAGVLVGITGGLGQRRASTWLGAAVVAVGLGLVIDDLDGDSQWGTIALAAGCAIVLLAVGHVLAARLREPIDGEPPDAVLAPLAALPATEASEPPAPMTWSAPTEPPAQPPAPPSDEPAQDDD